MKYYRKIFLFLFLGACIAPVSFSQKKVDVFINADYNSVYLWRGLTFSEGSVMQPSVNFSYRNINLNIWGNVDFGNQYDQKLNEVDYALSYKISGKKFEIEPILQFYTYPKNEVGPSTGEFGVKMSLFAGEFTFFTSQNFDIVEYKGAYSGDISAGYEYNIGKNHSLGAAIGLGWANSKFNEPYTGLAKGTFNSVFINMFSFHSFGKVSVKPRLEISRIPDKEIREITWKGTIVNAGLSLGVDL